MARYRGSSEQRGVGTAHRADKKRLERLHRDGDPCWRCGQPMYKWQKLERDHIVDRALGGAQGPAVLAHAACNRSAGARLGNQLQPRTILAAGRDTICAACGRPYHYAARRCEICGAHYHPNGREQRTCGRACGVVLHRRNRMARGWVPPAQRPKPAPKPKRPGPVASGERQPKNGWPAVAIAYYTCRYCGKLGINRPTTYQPREVCRARSCQLLRLKANNWRTRYGLTQSEADAAVTGGQVATSRSLVHICPGCGERTSRPRWCDECLCTSANASGKRCGNRASDGGKCDYHAGALTASARQW